MELKYAGRLPAEEKSEMDNLRSEAERRPERRTNSRVEIVLQDFEGKEFLQPNHLDMKYDYYQFAEGIARCLIKENPHLLKNHLLTGRLSYVPHVGLRFTFVQSNEAAHSEPVMVLVPLNFHPKDHKKSH